MSIGIIFFMGNLHIALEAMEENLKKLYEIFHIWKMLSI